MDESPPVAASTPPGLGSLSPSDRNTSKARPRLPNDLIDTSNDGSIGSQESILSKLKEMILVAHTKILSNHKKIKQLEDQERCIQEDFLYDKCALPEDQVGGE